MDELYAVFWEQVHYSGFLQRRLYTSADGKKLKGMEGSWSRSYVELKGPILRCWCATSCDPNPAAISRLKEEALSHSEMEYGSMDIRSISFEILEDFAVDRDVYNAFSLNYAEGMDKVQFMAVNSSVAKEWINILLKVSKEAEIFDQRYTLRLLASTEVPIFADITLPVPPETLLRWPGSGRWTRVVLSVEAKRGLLHRAVSNSQSNGKSKCIYLYEDMRRKTCLARLAKITGVYALHQSSSELGCYDLIVEGEGKLKSSKLTGLRLTERAWLRTDSQELWLRWINVLRNIFELCTPKSILATLEVEHGQPSVTKPARSTVTTTSDSSMRSDINRLSDDLRRTSIDPWRKAQRGMLTVLVSCPSI